MSYRAGKLGLFLLDTYGEVFPSRERSKTNILHFYFPNILRVDLMKILLLFAALSSVLCCTTAQAVTFEWAQIGYVDNYGDDEYPNPYTGNGTVFYEYAISKTEVTNAQYVEFLNGVAKSDPYGLYHAEMGSSTAAGIIRTGASGNYTYSVKPNAQGAGPSGADYTYANKPVIYVDWYDTVRFANWLHNGQADSDTENGAYTLLGETTA